MSFSSETKEELSRLMPEKTCCQLAELSALIRMSGTLEMQGSKNVHIELHTENPSIARKMFKLIKQLTHTLPEMQIRQTPRFQRGKQYLLRIQQTAASFKILEKTGILVPTKEGLELLSTPPHSLIRDRCCSRSYIRGAFLGGGSMSAPEKNYHIEFVSSNENHLQVIRNLLQRFDLEARQILRKNYHVLYLKEGEQIVDLLNIMGAHHALLSLENIRIMKQMRNTVNRVVNCETANLSKTVQASMRQVEMIELIDQRIGLQQLPKGLREVALLRLKYPEASLKELGEMMDPPVGKSGINHRFRKLEQIERKLKQSAGSRSQNS